MDTTNIGGKVRRSQLKILYQDEWIAVVEKPCGLAVQGGEGVGVCVSDVLSAQLGREIFPVHRLDKDTAGILVTALSRRAAALYTGFFGGKKIGKRYQAVCLHVPRRLSGEIRAPLEKKGNFRRHAASASRAADSRAPDFRTVPAVQEAVTFYEVKKASADGAFCLVSLRIETGRTHQIRRHLALEGFPVAADDKYGDFRRNREIRGLYGIKKLQLAATALSLPLLSGDGGIARRIELTCPLPPHMQACVERVFGAD